MLSPSLAFVSVPHHDLLIAGPFQQLLQPLSETLEVPQPAEGRVIVPCLAQQLPAVQSHFPDATVLKVVENCADAQANIRTVTLRPELQFGYHLKLSFNGHITSGIRTITRWTALGGPVISDILKMLLPANLWVFEEVAAATGSQSDFSAGRHLTCILRKDLEPRAAANNETLIVAAVLTERPVDDSRTYAEILFDLDTIDEKKDWFRRYLHYLLKVTLIPLVQHGIGLEAHGQNIVARVCIRRRVIKGFAVRDFGGIRMHGPTLEAQGFNFQSIPPGRTTITNDLEHIWDKVHHALLQNHVGYLLSSLGLDDIGGWAIVRDELSAVLNPDKGGLGQQLYGHFLKDTMPFTCFMTMKFEGTYRSVVTRDVPNTLLLHN